MPFDPPGDADEPFFEVPPPEWISRFVKDEIRPFLLQNREEILAALNRWLASHAEQLARKTEWGIRREDYIRGLAAAAIGNPDTPPPGPDWTWCDSWWDPTDERHKLVRHWLPPEYNLKNQPSVYSLPLPPPMDRDVSPDECVAALVAAHDVCRVREERLGPEGKALPNDDRLVPELCRRMPFAELFGHALDLQEAHLPDLRAMLERAKTLISAPNLADPKLTAIRHQDTAEQRGEHAKIDAPPAEAGAGNGKEASTPIASDDDKATMGIAYIVTAHQQKKRMTVKQLAEHLNVNRSALYENAEFAELRELANRLFGLFGKERKQGDWDGAMQGDV